MGVCVDWLQSLVSKKQAGGIPYDEARCEPTRFSSTSTSKLSSKIILVMKGQGCLDISLVCTLYCFSMCTRNDWNLKAACYLVEIAWHMWLGGDRSIIHGGDHSNKTMVMGIARCWWGSLECNAKTYYRCLYRWDQKSSEQVMRATKQNQGKLKKAWGKLREIKYINWGAPKDMITSLLEVHRTRCCACAVFDRIKCSKELNGCFSSLDELSVCASDTHTHRCDDDFTQTAAPLW